MIIDFLRHKNFARNKNNKLKHTSGKKKCFVPVSFIQRRNDDAFGSRRMDKRHFAVAGNLVNNSHVRNGASAGSCKKQQIARSYFGNVYGFSRACLIRRASGHLDSVLIKNFADQTGAIETGRRIPGIFVRRS